MLTLNTASQVVMKLAAGLLRDYPFGMAWLVKAAASPYIWAMLACEGINFILWLAILKRHTLTIAFPLSGITYALVLAASWAILQEPVHILQLLGTALILFGIVLMGQSAPPTIVHPNHARLL